VIPLRDTVPTRHLPVVTLALIAINVAVFVVELTAPQQHLPTTRGQVFAVDDVAALGLQFLADPGSAVATIGASGTRSRPCWPGTCSCIHGR
jgi:hypothetical protein